MVPKKTGNKKTRALIRDLGTKGAKTLSRADLKKTRGGRCSYGKHVCSKLVVEAKPTRLTVVLPKPPLEPIR